MDNRKTIYFGASGFIIFLALATITSWLVSSITFSPITDHIVRYTGVPFIFLFPAGIALTWFIGQSLEVGLKWKILVGSCLGLSGLLWAYLATAFFFGSIVH